MNRLKGLFFFISVLYIGHINAQETPFTLRTNFGLATYYGDLTEKPKLFSQSSPSFSIGLGYDFTDQIIGKFDFSIMKLKGDDRFNDRVDLKNRNLNFTTTLWDLSLGVEYEFLNIISEDYLFTPYLGIGIGISHFNPWTYDRTGVKRYLRDFATEGQGLPSYPERKVYSKFSMVIPINFGIKYAINENIRFVFDVNLRKPLTDYLDDVGNTYPDQSIILNESLDPITTLGLTYRGDEISSAPYPSIFLPRGGFTQDFYYTVNIGVSVRLNNIVVGSGNKVKSGRVYRPGRTNKSGIRNPNRVF